MFRVGRFQAGPFRLPTEGNWAKQHPRIRTPRPLVDRFNLGNLHPNKEWWRERRHAPTTFMGFPDIALAEVRGGSLYIEQMDAATLAVVVEKCVSSQSREDNLYWNDVWMKLRWRAQQLTNSLGETDLAYLFRGFSRSSQPADPHLLLSLWARTDFLLPRFSLPDLSVLVEGYANTHFVSPKYQGRVLVHMLDLVENRPGWTPDELCKAAVALGHTQGGTQKRIMHAISHQLEPGSPNGGVS